MRWLLDRDFGRCRSELYRVTDSVLTSVISHRYFWDWFASQSDTQRERLTSAAGNIGFNSEMN